jgi:hypothetical protein
MRGAVVDAWRGSDGAPRTRPIFVASVCAGVLGFTLARAFGIDLLLAYVLTVVGVFLVATLVLVRR